ncbi:MAG: hypothetical protein GXP45_06190 [bacterium]|nr:hypothetical protein [bacterium]
MSSQKDNEALHIWAILMIKCILIMIYFSAFLFPMEVFVDPLIQEQETKKLMTQNHKKNFWHRMSFLGMDKDKKAEIADEILTETYNSKLYWLEMVLSSLLATLGLLTNSVPVIIGAMLIAPILQPIKAFSFAVSTGNKTLYFKALKIL